jgi:hypothetical protein
MNLYLGRASKNMEVIQSPAYNFNGAVFLSHLMEALQKWMTMCCITNGHMSLAVASGHFDMAWSKIALAGRMIFPIECSAIPFCQWVPTTQKVDF